MPRSPQWMDLYQIWFRVSSRGRNQLCGILLQSAHHRSWVSILWGVKIHHLPLTWPVAVNTVLALPHSLWFYVIVCICCKIWGETRLCPVTFLIRCIFGWHLGQPANNTKLLRHNICRRYLTCVIVHLWTSAYTLFDICERELMWLDMVINVNKNLAIANRSRVSCAHNTSSAFIGLNITPWPWNLG